MHFVRFWTHLFYFYTTIIFYLPFVIYILFKTYLKPLIIFRVTTSSACFFDTLFTFKHAPLICIYSWNFLFRNLRQMFRLDAADYMMSICGDDGLRELPSPGKSGSLFYLSHDDRFLIKTLKKSELKVCANSNYHWLKLLVC